MNKSFKRFISTMLVACMAMSMVASAAGTENDYAAMTNAHIAEIASISERDVEQMRLQEGDRFNEVVAEYLGALVVDSGARASVRMTIQEWNALAATLAPGIILLTKDQSSSGYRHGHAAICWGNTDIIEHPGLGQLSRKTTAYSSFRDKSSVASFKPGTTLGAMSDAAVYAYTSLIGWSYFLTAGRTDTNQMNCATLVWKAYDHANVNVCAPKGGAYTVLPKYLDVDGYNTKLYATPEYNNLKWAIG